MESLLPQAVPLVVSDGLGVGFEGDVGRSTGLLDYPKVPLAEIRLIRRNLADGEIVGGGLHQGRELRGVGSHRVVDLCAGDDVGLNAADDVGLNPAGLFDLLSPFLTEPSMVDAGGEAAGVHGEVLLHGLEGRCALLNQAFEDWSQVGILQVAGDAGERGHPVHHAVRLCVPNVAHGPAPRS